MQKNNIWFTLIEIIVSTIILSVWVFGIYKLLSINTNNLNNWENLNQSKKLITNTEECIKSIWYNYFYNSSQTWYSFNFWNDNNWCFTWDYNSSTWIFLDNKNYFIKWTISSKDTNKIVFDLSSETDWINTQTWTFSLYK